MSKPKSGEFAGKVDRDEVTSPGEQKKPDETPAVVSFALVRHHFEDGDRWGAVAIESRGDRILRTRVLEIDSIKAHVVFWLERVRHNHYQYGEDPFEEREVV